MPPIPWDVQLMIVLISSSVIVLVSYSKLKFIDRLLLIAFIVFAIRSWVLQ